MPPLSTIICTDCWTKSKGLYLLLLAVAALCNRKIHFWCHFSPFLPPFTHLGMFILTWKWACVSALAVASHSSLAVWFSFPVCVRFCMCVCLTVLALYYIAKNTFLLVLFSYGYYYSLFLDLDWHGLLSLLSLHSPLCLFLCFSFSLLFVLLSVFVLLKQAFYLSWDHFPTCSKCLCLIWMLVNIHNL